MTIQSVIRMGMYLFVLFWSIMSYIFLFRRFIYRRLFLWIHVLHFDFCPAQKVNTIFQPILFGIYNPLNTGLYDELGAFNARRCGHVECAAVTVVSTSGQLRDGIRFGMKHVWERGVVIVFTHVGEPTGSSIIAIADKDRKSTRLNSSHANI